MSQNTDDTDTGKDGTPRDTTHDDETREEFIKRIVNSLPPLTEEQKDLLALIFARHRKH